MSEPVIAGLERLWRRWKLGRVWRWQDSPRYRLRKIASRFGPRTERRYIEIADNGTNAQVAGALKRALRATRDGGA